MKCPYQKKVIHKPVITDDGIKCSEDITEFCECLRLECPFYYTNEYKSVRIITEHCRRVDSEVKK